MSAARLEVLACTGAASLQDGGRIGYQRYGLSGSGPMDRLAMAVANALLGNPAEAPTLELGLAGGRFRAEGAALRLALAGAPCTIRVEGSLLAGHRSFVLPEGAELAIEPPREGMFAYLAVAGGFLGTPVLGSLSLHQRAGIGGIEGRPLRAGDVLKAAGDGGPGGCRTIEAVALHRDAPIRVVLGPQDGLFSHAGLATLTSEAFTVNHRADRMGYQLDGPCIAHGPSGYNIVSDATAMGAIQVPGSGLPIVLMADRQTTGGYPKIATIVSADLRRMAQRRPGDIVRFEAIPLAAAFALARTRAAEMAGSADRVRPLAGLDADRLLSANLAGQAVDALGDEP